MNYKKFKEEVKYKSIEYYKNEINKYFGKE